MDPGKVCIEVALNGPWTRRLQPAIPLDRFLLLPSAWVSLIVVTGVFLVLCN